jgi:hypothetical protein
MRGVTANQKRRVADRNGRRNAIRRCTARSFAAENCSCDLPAGRSASDVRQCQNFVRNLNELKEI